MELIDIITPNFEFGDERGSLVQLVRDGYKQVNVIKSIKGCIRGGHFHKYNWEAFYVISGKFDVIVRYRDDEKTISFKAGDMFKIPPLVAHDFIYREDTVLISMYDVGVEISTEEKDIYKG